MRKILLSLLCLIVCNILIGCFEDKYEHEARYKIKAEIRVNTEAEIKVKLGKYSEINGYKLRVARVHPDEPVFSISLEGENSMILGANPFDTQEYHFSIFAGVSANKSQQYYEAQLNEFKNEITGIREAKP